MKECNNFSCKDIKFLANISMLKGKTGKAIPVTDRGGPQGCDTSRMPRFSENRLRDGGEVVGLMRRPPYTFQEDSWYSFPLKAESTVEVFDPASTRELDTGFSRFLSYYHFKRTEYKSPCLTVPQLFRCRGNVC
jgi:hypothetical protein